MENHELAQFVSSSPTSSVMCGTSRTKSSADVADCYVKSWIVVHDNVRSFVGIGVSTSDSPGMLVLYVDAYRCTARMD